MNWQIIFASAFISLLACRSSSSFLPSLFTESDRIPSSHSVWSAAKSYVSGSSSPSSPTANVGPTIAGKAAEAWNAGAQTAEYLAKKIQVNPDYAADGTRRLEEKVSKTIKGTIYQEEMKPSFWEAVKKMYRRAVDEEEEVQPRTTIHALGETWDRTKETASDYLQRMKDVASDTYYKTTGSASDYSERAKRAITPEEEKSLWQKTKEKVSEVYYKVAPDEETSFFELTPAQEAKLRASGKLAQYRADATAIWRDAKGRMANLYETATENTPEETQWKIMGNIQSIWTATRRKIADLYHRATSESEDSWEQAKEKAAEYGQRMKETAQGASSKVSDYVQRYKDAASDTYSKASGKAYDYGARMKDIVPEDEGETVWKKTKQKVSDMYHKVLPDSESAIFGLTPAQQARLQAAGTLSQYRNAANKVWRDAKANVAEVYRTATTQPTEEAQAHLAQQINMIWSQAKDKAAKLYETATGESETSISGEIRSGPAWEEAKERAADYSQKVKEKAARLSHEAAERVRATYRDAEQQVRY